MAVTMTLDDASDLFSFSPLVQGYQEPEDRGRIVHTALDGTVYVYEPFVKKRWVIPVNNVSSTYYGYVLNWWENNSTLTFIPDTTVPGTTYSVKMFNEENPLQMMFSQGFANKYEGTLFLREL